MPEEEKKKNTEEKSQEGDPKKDTVAGGNKSGVVKEENDEKKAGDAQGAKTAPKGKKKKGKIQIQKGHAYVKCTYNNTIIAISDMNGAILGWSSAGLLGFKGAKKSTPYAATQVAADVSEKVKKFGLREVTIYIKGVGGGREASIRGLAANGFDFSAIKDITPNPHNGCRPRKPRRV